MKIFPHLLYIFDLKNAIMNLQMISSYLWNNLLIVQKAGMKSQLFSLFLFFSFISVNFKDETMQFFVRILLEQKEKLSNWGVAEIKGVLDNGRYIFFQSQGMNGADDGAPARKGITILTDAFGYHSWYFNDSVFLWNSKYFKWNSPKLRIFSF